MRRAQTVFGFGTTVSADTIKSVELSPTELKSTRASVQKTCFSWKIENFSRKINSENSYASPMFCTEKNLQFNITLQASDKVLSQNWVSLYLKHELHTQTEVLLNAKMCLLNRYGEVFHSKKQTVVFQSDLTSWGYKEFFSTKELFAQSEILLPEDTLTVRCEISVPVDETSKSFFCSNKSIIVTNLVKDISSLLKNAVFSDMTIVVGEEKFPVHRNILAARSPVFARMFAHEMAESIERRVYIDDFDVETVKRLLEFIYTGEVELSDFGLRTKLLAISDKYDMDDLKIICEEQFIWDLWVDNAVETLLLADKHNALHLKKSCLSFICKNAADVFSTSEWKKYRSQLPELANKLFETFALMDSNYGFKP